MRYGEYFERAKRRCIMQWKTSPGTENSIDEKEEEIVDALEKDQVETPEVVMVCMDKEDMGMVIQLQSSQIMDPVVVATKELKPNKVVEKQVTMFEVEVIRKLEILVYLFESAADELTNYFISIHAKVDPDILHICPCIGCHRCARLMDRCAIYKALNWT